MIILALIVMLSVPKTNHENDSLFDFNRRDYNEYYIFQADAIKIILMIEGISIVIATTAPPAKFGILPNILL